MTLQGRPTLWICAAGFIAACNSESKDPTKARSAAPVSASAESLGNRVQDSAQPMSGMDHANMPGMQPSPGSKPPVASGGGAAPMAGMDHSKMNMAPAASSATPRSRASTDMAGMDHSQMNMGTVAPRTTGRAQPPGGMQGMAGMDHGTMAPNPARGTSQQPTQARRSGMAGMAGMAGTGPMAGMDHSQMAGMQIPSMSATQIADRKLQMIAAALLKDPDILRRVQADSVLRNRWSDPSVRTQISAAAGSEHK